MAWRAVLRCFQCGLEDEYEVDSGGSCPGCGTPLGEAGVVRVVSTGDYAYGICPSCGELQGIPTDQEGVVCDCGVPAADLLPTGITESDGERRWDGELYGKSCAIEKSSSFHGLYHVLGGAISPLEGKKQEELEIGSLIARVKQGNIKEIILAMDADTEGEATALYLTQLLKPAKIKLSRIGMGIPSGANLEYIDSSTIASALNGRRSI